MPVANMTIPARCPLNAAERHNVSAIKKVEAKEGC